VVVRTFLAICFVACVALYAVAFARAGLVFQEDFNGGLTNWVPRVGCPHEGFSAPVCYNPKNVTVSGGAMHLFLRKGTMGRRYDAAEVGTYLIGYGMPPKVVKHSWAPPLTIKASAQYSGVPGTWMNFGTYGVDRVKPVEFDIAENRGSYPRMSTCHIHDRTVPLHWSAELRDLPFNITTGYHEYTLKMPDAHHVSFSVDDILCGTHTINRIGLIGILFTMKTADPSQCNWCANVFPVVPAEMKVDWVRVWKP
jgi:hypothetical protein